VGPLKSLNGREIIGKQQCSDTETEIHGEQAPDIEKEYFKQSTENREDEWLVF
jgi:hypothetical protein